MNVYDVINSTKQKVPLTHNQISYLVNGYVDGTIPDYQVSAWLMAVCLNGLSEEETYHLTDIMRLSGETMDWHSVDGTTADKHSTGGIGDTTTLIVAPTVASCGIKMPKMSGRGLGYTGGTIDKLESIPNYDVYLPHSKFIQCVESVGCAIVSQSGNLTPADKKLYALRDVTATVDSIPLISSSIMSKKLAMNTDSIVLDVKCGSGAFMKDLESATRLANCMVAIGKRSNHQCSALVTNMDAPLSTYVGNALEVVGALEVLKGNSHGRLFELSVELSTEVVSQGLQLEYDVAKARVLDALTSGKALETFTKMVQYQGGNPHVVEDYTLMGKARYSYPVKCKVSGYVQAIASESVGMVSLELGAGRHTKSDSIDYSAGIVFHYCVGDWVSAGDTIATLYSSTITDYSQCESRLLSAVTIGSTAPPQRGIVLSRVS